MNRLTYNVQFTIEHDDAERLAEIRAEVQDCIDQLEHLPVKDLTAEIWNEPK